MFVDDLPVDLPGSKVYQQRAHLCAVFSLLSLLATAGYSSHVTQFTAAM
jgi:hypothetical protein